MHAHKRELERALVRVSGPRELAREVCSIPYRILGILLGSDCQGYYSAQAIKTMTHTKGISREVSRATVALQ